MIIAVTSSGNSLDSKIGMQCGRCNYFMLYYSKNKTKVFITNPYSENEENIAEDVMKFLLRQKVNMLVAGAIGTKLEAALTQNGIRVVLNNPEMSVEEITNYLFNKESGICNCSF